jgi:hypothetical protein
MKNNNEQSLPNKKRPKKAYQRPELEVYGDLRNITQALGVKGPKDGGMGGNQKTH